MTNLQDNAPNEHHTKFLVVQTKLHSWIMWKLRDTSVVSKHSSDALMPQICVFIAFAVITIPTPASLSP